MQKTFLMVKPDGVERGLIGKVISRFEEKGYHLKKAEMTTISPEKAREHYAEHEGKPFFEELVSFITSGPVFAMVWEGEEIISIAREMIGKTNVREAVAGTIRGDYANSTRYNIIHGSDSVESAKREIQLFFGE